MKSNYEIRKWKQTYYYIIHIYRKNVNPSISKKAKFLFFIKWNQK